LHVSCEPTFKTTRSEHFGKFMFLIKTRKKDIGGLKALKSKESSQSGKSMKTPQLGFSKKRSFWKTKPSVSL